MLAPPPPRNCLFLATTDNELLQALALCSLIEEGWVEPLRPPPRPAHLLAQQPLARVLADTRLGRSTWPGIPGASRVGGRPRAAECEATLRHIVDHEILLDLGGILQMGVAGERLFGRRHFMDVTSMFLTEPLLSVRWGSRLLGQVDPSALMTRTAGGR